MSSEATPSAGLYEVLAWLEIHKKRILAGVAIGAVVALAVSYFFWHRAQRQLAASEALLQVTMAASAEGPNARPSPADLLRVASDYAGTPAAARAQLLAAGAHFSSGQYAEALAEFERFRQRHPRSSMIHVADLGVAATLESLNRADEALPVYEKAVDTYANQPAAQQARLAIARICEAKQQHAKAVQLYDDLLAQPDRGYWAAEARERRERLLAAHPELAKTNAPVLGATVTNLIQGTTQVRAASSAADSAPAANPPAPSNAPPSAATPAPGTNAPPAP
ncbi:MAG TPA: tetratricopeptide repeat protein [Candidatus Paceibacterota bacterium]|nr:tetratricopeptide repeat protein [Verrucomicrobiota bacterium]HRZ45638.1 tetratricopeptide repeat protein [Candidatus Paceibacterota bacterium]HRZ94203.1 tetratricopeptide repeat protein [Candidatus Paceibacterota bacterium]